MNPSSVSLSVARPEPGRTAKSPGLRLWLAAALLAIPLAACGGKTGPKAVLEGLPTYKNADVVREWEQDGAFVREYAVSEEADTAATAVTQFYTGELEADGWTVGPSRAALTSFTKGKEQLILGRVGPQVQDAPDGAKVSRQIMPPGDARFFYTLEVKEINE
jgi:hypothetical protein